MNIRRKIFFKNLIFFLKQETVLVVASMLAIVSCFFVTPSRQYLDYIDFRVLALLFCLMLIVSGFRHIGFFAFISKQLFAFIHTLRMAVFVFILLCFFCSMLITNDVALILFVPLSLFMLKDFLTEKLTIFLLVFETLAANLGSMFTPIGNPQNLYIFSSYNFRLLHFFQIMAPYTLVSFVLLILCTFLFPKTALEDDVIPAKRFVNENLTLHYSCYLILFILVLLTVVRLIPYTITLSVCVIVIALLKPALFKKVDYYLLLTFMAFFIFVGNMGHIESIKNFITHLTQGNEFSLGIVLSQFISNVPATLLLSDFTDNASSLLIGVNLGGLGTIIASMASLISYKFYAAEKKYRILPYFLWFTLFNIAFLAVLVLTYVIL